MPAFLYAILYSTLQAPAARPPAFVAPNRITTILEASPRLPPPSSPGFKSAVESVLADPQQQGASADAILELGPTYAREPHATLWTVGRPNLELVRKIDDLLTDALRKRLLAEHGIPEQDARALLSSELGIVLASPVSKGNSVELIMRGSIPAGLAYALLMVLLLTGSWMLQGLVEERSGKLIEAPLASVTPDELLGGKMLGALGIGLGMVIVWTACAVLAVWWRQGPIFEAIRSAALPLLTPVNLAVAICFFLSGYIMASLIFVAIGSVSDSMRESQAYLGPLSVLLMVPVMLMLQAVLAGSGGAALWVMTCLPLYTPFVILSRLGTDIGTVELLGAGIWMLAWILVEVWLVLKLFRANLLGSGKTSFLAWKLKP